MTKKVVSEATGAHRYHMVHNSIGPAAAPIGHEVVDSEDQLGGCRLHQCRPLARLVGAGGHELEDWEEPEDQALMSVPSCGGQRMDPSSMPVELCLFF
eukprot:CAMPEP_0204358506 /NCGR_PEP_ID=MMETSP0469-20131031/36574_1 /ASSEMBLY_ACC=CAM_ASM_000384 /TAXON_ID=2969 /ORGANISM="Oxyrrhis marina" /LENGTH=97 /DNA_ID=CAMNT_0051346391 /DNA_START=62 /DNA_END=352 /DNA_ORIENTATION=+